MDANEDAKPFKGPRLVLLREFPWAGVVAVFDWDTGQARNMSANAYHYWQEEFCR